MFTRTELDTIFQMVRSKKLSLHQPLTIQASNDPGSEADLFFFRGARKQYESDAHFWLRCITWLEEYRKGFQLLMAQRYPNHIHVNSDTTSPVDRPYLYQTVAPENFQEIIEGHSLQLQNAHIPHTYQWEGQIQQAMQMSNEWNDQSLIAETEQEFLAFFWETGA